MSKPLSLLLACLTIFCLFGISGSIAYRSTWGILLFAVLTIATMGLGFSLKARSRKRDATRTS